MKNFFNKFSGSFKRANENPQNSPSKKPKIDNGSQNSPNKTDKFGQNLPIASAKAKFMAELGKNHSTMILIGETGSGKTTQIPQFLHEFDPKGKICISQPRRMAAISLAKRVAQEMGQNLGEKVGYKVRFEDVSCVSSRVMFLTDGMLLREAILDPNLSSYNWVMIDEAHERSLNTDILFGVVKRAQKNRKQAGSTPLRILITSATLDAEKFSTYFSNCPILYVHGRQFPVDIYHTTESLFDWQMAALKTVVQIHQEAKGQEDILVFLTGQEEIEGFCNQLRQVINTELNVEPQSVKMLPPIPLYAAQSAQMQQRVFDKTKFNQRKVIVSTNIAETSLTIPGVKFVVDSCRVKAKLHFAKTGVDLLKVVKVSKSQAVQRAGRAGRETEGQCYRMISRSDFESLEENFLPEILRSNLSNVILQLMAMGIEDVLKFDFLDKPDVDSVQGALRQLQLLGAVNNSGLTDLGRKFASFPLEPRFTKAILCAQELGCTEEVLTVVSILSGESISVTPAGKREEALLARKKFTSSEGDHITGLKIFRAFQASKDKKEFCRDNYLHFRHLTFVAEVRKQLMEVCRREGIVVQSAGAKVTEEDGGAECVRKALAQGLFTHVARLANREGNYVTLDTKQTVLIHPSSVLFKSKPELLVYTELISTQKNYIRDLSLVQADWLLQAQPEYFRQHRIVS